MDKKKVELLAPAGNAEAFYGALNAGADAVYLGGRAFGARAFADNFTDEELLQCLRYAHLFGKKVYLTVNTLVKEQEFTDLYDFLKPLAEAKLDGIIVQDMGVLSFVHEHFPTLPLHASTQMTITGGYGAKFLKRFGVTRVVPARELSLNEIISLKDKCNLEVECFVHGAMCYCYSGQCLFSSILGGRSGNRGRCAQPCRLPYTIEDNKTIKDCYPLSLKDMCTIELLPKLLDAGIDSFKIEGRMKKPEYSAGVTAIYRKYIDLYYSGREYKVSREDLKDLADLYLRSLKETGYYEKHNGKEMITFTSPSYNGSNEKLLAKVHDLYLEQKKKQEIMAEAEFTVGKAAKLTLFLGDISASVFGDMVETASKQPISEENIRKQLCKLGDTAFLLRDPIIWVDEQAFYPLKAINELRRKGVEALEDAILNVEGYGKNIYCDLKDYALQPKNREGKSTSLKGYSIKALKIDQLRAIREFCKEDKEHSVKKVYIHGDLYLNERKDTEEFCKEFANVGDVYVSLPEIVRKKDESYLEKLYNILVSLPFIKGVQFGNLEGLAYFEEKEFGLEKIADHSLYAWNIYALEELKKVFNGFCFSLELRKKERFPLNYSDESIYSEQMIYGRIPLMKSANCVAKTGCGCKKGKADENGCVVLTDRYRKKFPVILNCSHCYNVIYNSVPVTLGSGEVTSDFGRLDFTVENPKEVREVLEYYIIQKGKSTPPWKEYTTGYEKRGVE